MTVNAAIGNTTINVASITNVNSVLQTISLVAQSVNVSSNSSTNLDTAVIASSINPGLNQTISYPTGNTVSYSLNTTSNIYSFNITLKNGTVVPVLNIVAQYISVFHPANPPQGSALILYTDIVDGPISGGENNKGTYISVFGINLGNFSDWGNTSHLLIGGHEVDNYRCLVPAVNDSNTSNTGLGNGVGSTFGIWRLVAQIGSIGSPTIGTPLAITCNISGNGAINALDANNNYLDFDNNPITFTPVNGTILFVDKANGVDQTSGTAPTGSQGTIGSPLRHLQTYNGTNFGGAIWGIGSGTVSTTNCVKPGTHVIIRGGDYSADTSWNGTDNTGKGSWCDFFRRTGNPGSSNTNASGAIVINSYPGAAGANSPEAVIYKTGSGNCGGFNLCNTNDSNLSTPWGELGYCHNINIVNMLVWGTTGTYNGNGAAASGVNLQTHAMGFRCINLDIAIPLANGSPLTGGIGGYGTNGRRIGNFVHDIYDPSGGLQCHGFYIGENTGSNNPAGVGELHGVNAFNCIQRVTGGQAIMMRGAYQTETAPFCTVHHNWCEGMGKFGIELFDQRDRGLVWNNIVIGKLFTAPGTTGTQACLQFGSDNITVANGIYCGFNTCLGPVEHYAVVYGNGGANTGSVLLEGNIFYQDPTGGSPPFGTWGLLNSNGMTFSFNKNIWFDATGNDTSKPSGDTLGLFADPKLVNIAGRNLYPNTTANSPCINAGPTATLTQGNTAYDLFFAKRPFGSNTHLSLGALG